MKKLIAALAVVVAMIFATLLALRSGEPPNNTHALLEAQIRQCTLGRASLAFGYEKMSEHLRDYVTTDPARALAIARGQVANVIDGRLATCERALAIAQHDKLGSAVMALGPPVDKLKGAHVALGALVTALESGSDATGKLDALEAAVR